MSRGNYLSAVGVGRRTKKAAQPGPLTRPRPFDRDPIAAVAAALSAVILAVDISVPLGIASPVLYFVPVLLTVWATGERATELNASIATVFTLLGYAFSPPGGVAASVATNRFLALIVIWVIATFTILRRERSAELLRLNRSLARQVAERERAQAALAIEKERAETTLHSIGDAVVATDSRCIIRYVNPMAEALIGWSRAEAVGQHLDTILELVDEETGERAPSPVKRCLADGKIASLDRPTLLRDRHGNELSITDSAAPIRTAAGETDGAVLVFSDVTGARALEREIAHQATHDALTGLVNRRQFELDLEGALRESANNGTHHALCYLDLDQFKIINDTCGHAAGDELLRQVAGLLGEHVRKGDTLARLGGDEFGVLMEQCTVTQAERVTGGMLGALRSFRFHWDRRSFAIGASLGLVPIPASGLTVQDVLNAADGACYTAKNLGRNRVHVYREDDADIARHQSEIAWISRLRSALDEDRFRLSYQPIVPITGTAPDGGYRCELLLRLEDPDEGTVLPGTFLPAAERYDLAERIDRWVVRAALSWLAGKPRECSRIEMCSINLSGVSIASKTFYEFVAARLDEFEIPGDKICFEITETAAVANISAAAHFIRRLSARGCSFALDDFGSGMCSFAYLKSFSADYLKIDGQFVRDICDNPVSLAVVRSISEIGQSMGKKIVAECVENEAILSRLQDVGVDFVQGYGVGAPEPLRDFPRPQDAGPSCGAGAPRR